MSKWLLGAALVLALAGCGGGGSSSDGGAAPHAGGSGGGSPPSGGGSSSGGSGGGGSAPPGGGAGSSPPPAGIGPDTSIGSFNPAGGVEVFSTALVSQGSFDVAIGGTGAFTGFDVAIGGTGAVAGPIQGFSSVIVNDQTIATGNAAFSIEGSAGSQADLRQGQQVLVAFERDSLEADEVRYRSNVKGPLTALNVIDPLLGQASLTVFGQSVVTNAGTFFTGTDLATLATGDLLEVSGALDPNGVIVATFIAADPTIAAFKATGTVAGVTASEFTLGGLTVDYSSATLVRFDGQPVSDGQAVEVRGPPAAFTSPGSFRAETVERLPRVLIAEDAEVELEGRITHFVTSQDFDVAGQPVTTTAGTVFDRGSATDLRLGRRVEAEGNVDANGVLVATRVVVKRDNAVRLEGPLQSVDTAARTLGVLDVSVQVRDSTRFKDESAASADPLTLADLVPGERVEVRAFLDGDAVVASRIERADPDDRARLRGPLEAADATSGTVTVLGVTLATASGVTRFEDAAENAISMADFFAMAQVGQSVSVRWDTFVATSEPVDKLTLEGEDD